jgi:hypothetical protein
MTIPDFSMYTDAGNQVVYELVTKAKLLHLTWAELYDEMQKIAETDPDASEITDTAVREIVYDYMGYDI